MKFWLANDDQTRQAGKTLATGLLPMAKEQPVVVFIRGNLGAGKSTLVRGFLTQAGVTGVMPSPTYSLVEPYKAGDFRLYHMDAYRLADGSELDYLGLDDADEPGSLLLVEWPDHVSDFLPSPTVTIDLALCSWDQIEAFEPASGSSQHSPEQGRHSRDNVDRHVNSVLDRQAAQGIDPGKENKSVKDQKLVPNSQTIGRSLSVTSGTLESDKYKILSELSGWSDLITVVT